LNMSPVLPSPKTGVAGAASMMGVSICGPAALAPGSNVCVKSFSSASSSTTVSIGIKVPVSTDIARDFTTLAPAMVVVVAPYCSRRFVRNRGAQERQRHESARAERSWRSDASTDRQEHRDRRASGVLGARECGRAKVVMVRDPFARTEKATKMRFERSCRGQRRPASAKDRASVALEARAREAQPGLSFGPSGFYSGWGW